MNVKCLATPALAMFAVMVLFPGNTTAKPPHPGARIELVVEHGLYRDIEPEIERHLAVLEDEGWSAAATRFSGTTMESIWHHLKDIYDSLGSLTGAILIGEFPVTAGGDVVYWTMKKCSTDIPYWFGGADVEPPCFPEVHRDSFGLGDIWVSRIPNQEEGHARQTLDASYYYRTGEHRLPHIAWTTEDPYGGCYDVPNKDSVEMANLKRVWDDVRDPVTDRPGYELYGIGKTGGEILVRAGHETPSFSLADPLNVRVAFISGCHAGEYGNFLSRYPATPGGGNVLTIGNMYSVDASDYRFELYLDDHVAELLNSGECWGTVMLALPERYFRFRGTFFYGDLSIAAKLAPPDTPPHIELLRDTPKLIRTGKRTAFDVQVSQEDAGYTLDWFMDWDYRKGLDPTWYPPIPVQYPDFQTEGSGSGAHRVSHTFRDEGRYHLHLALTGEWMAATTHHVHLRAFDGRDLNLKRIVSAHDPSLAVEGGPQQVVVNGSQSDQQYYWTGTVSLARSTLENPFQLWHIRTLWDTVYTYDFLNEGNALTLQHSDRKGVYGSATRESDTHKTWAVDSVDGDAIRIRWEGDPDLYLTASSGDTGAVLTLEPARSDLLQRWYIEDPHNATMARADQGTAQFPHISIQARGGSLLLDMGGRLSGSAEVRIFDARGALVERRRVTGSGGTIALTLGHLTHGAYYVAVQAGTTVLRERFLHL
ncbi:MAG: hypothetical protein GF344_12705 [Chitinivibrionales bacterium]|nr:hypothetical protein [Chitinivibrionales bacterium]